MTLIMPMIPDNPAELAPCRGVELNGVGMAAGVASRKGLSSGVPRELDGQRVYTLDYPKHQILMRADNREEGAWRLRACAKEPWTVEWIESMEPGAVFYDVGASTGPYSLVAASRGVRSFAFEPFAPSYARLVEHIRINKLSRFLTALPVALSSKTGMGLFNAVSLMVGSSAHEFWPLGERSEATKRPPKQQMLVVSFRIDDLVNLDKEFLPPPNYIKLDVDGVEGDVLEGAAATLRGPGLRSLMLEMDCGREGALMDQAHSLGLELVRRYDAAESSWRGPVGTGRAHTAYGLFRRAP